MSCGEFVCCGCGNGPDGNASVPGDNLLCEKCGGRPPPGPLTCTVPHGHHRPGHIRSMECQCGTVDEHIWCDDCTAKGTR